jgi:signal transduction histidine kinase
MKHPALLCCLPLFALAQTNSPRDSLLRLAHSAPHDTSRVWAYMEAGKLYLQTQADTAAAYLTQALQLAEQIGFDRGIARCRINRAFAYNNSGQYRNSIMDCQIALPICERLQLGRERVAAYNNMGNAWDYMGNHWQAIEAFSNALEAMQGVALPPHFPIVVRNNLARQYNNLGLYEKGFDYGQQNLREATLLGDSTQVAAALHVMAYCARMLHRDAEALNYCRRVERISRQTGDLPLLVFALNNIAVITYDQTPKRASAMLDEALQFARKSADLFGQVSCLKTRARFALWQQNSTQAHTYAQQALALAREQDMSDEIADSYLILSDIALAQGSTLQYRALRRRYNRLNDTLSNEALLHATQELETRYETEKKRQQIAVLERESELQRLRLREKNGLLWGLGSLSVLLFLTGFLTVRNLRHRRRLAEQTLQIQQQHVAQLEQQNQLDIADALLRGQEAERGRLARDLHDSLGGLLTSARHLLSNANVENPMLQQAAQTLDQATAELRHIARNMMPEALLRFGLAPALQDYCDHLHLASHQGIHFQSFGFQERLPQHIELALFRIAQELLNNALKHAQASQIIVQLMKTDNRTSLTVEDNGRGFNLREATDPNGVGWLNIRSRAAYIGAALDVRTQPGQGCSVTLHLDS